MAKTYTIDERWRNGRGADWTPNYDDWYADANAMGLYGEFSAADRALAQKNPYAAYGILWSKYDYANAPTDDAKALANANANWYRSDAGGYTAGSDGNQYQSVAPYGMMVHDTLGQITDYGPFSYGREKDYQNALNRVLNPDAFSYDLETDPSYIALRDQAVREGTRAMKNTLGQVSARTGGLASSYGVSAAQQANNYYLEKLNDQVPQLYQNAYNRYLQEYQMQMNALNALRTDKADEYGKYGDAYQRLLNTLSAQQGQEATEYNRAYQRDRDAVGDARNADETAYNRAWAEDERDYNRAWNEDERGYQRSQDALALQQAAEQRAAQEAAATDQQKISALIALANSGNTEAQQRLNEYYAMLAGVNPGAVPPAEPEGGPGPEPTTNRDGIKMDGYVDDATMAWALDSAASGMSRNYQNLDQVAGQLRKEGIPASWVTEDAFLSFVQDNDLLNSISDGLLTERQVLNLWADYLRSQKPRKG